jgi:hypothetical protein
VSPVRYELAFYIPEDIFHSQGRENIKFYIKLASYKHQMDRQSGR